MTGESPTYKLPSERDNRRGRRERKARSRAISWCSSKEDRSSVVVAPLIGHRYADEETFCGRVSTSQIVISDGRLGMATLLAIFSLPIAPFFEVDAEDDKAEIAPHFAFGFGRLEAQEPVISLCPCWHRRLRR